MPAPTKSSFISVHDCKVRQILTDTESATTYGDWVDVPDMLNFTVAHETDTKERRGDGVVKSKRSILTGITVTATASALSLEALVPLIGATLTASGTTPNEKQRLVYSKDSIAKPLEIVAQCLDAENLADAKLEVFKAVCTTPPEIGFEDDDFKEYEFELEGVALESTGEYWATEYTTGTVTAIDA
jgi:hypothetical protein